MTLTIATLSPEQRALAAELLYAHKMHGAAPCPGGKMPLGPAKDRASTETHDAKALDVLRSHGGWLRTRHVALMTGIKQDTVSSALYRLVSAGKLEKRITAGGRAEWRAMK